MSLISKGRASSMATLRAIERDVIYRLGLVLGRKPFDMEIVAEAANEYKKQLEEKRKSRQISVEEMVEVRDHVTELKQDLKDDSTTMILIENMICQVLKRLPDDVL